MRSRITLSATLIVALALVLGAVGFYVVLRSSVLGSATASAEARAEEIADRIDGGGTGILSSLDDVAAWVVSGDALVAVTDEVEGEVLPTTEGLVTIDGEPFVVASEGLDGDGTLFVGTSVEDDLATLGTVTVLLAVAVPLLLVLVAVTTWFVVGRALRPVARIRQEAEGITAERLHRRVPVPDSADEIAALAVTMNGMLDRLDVAAQAQRRFVSDASHELRSPLATIRQHAELAGAHPEATSTAELAEVVRDEGLRLQGIIDALLLLARLDEHAATSSEPVDLDDLALAEVSRLRAAGHDVDGSGIHAGRVQGDARLLGQLVRNLADNAARHARSRIAIGVAVADGRVFLTVEDDGAGIPAAERERVFERFVRLDEARARDAGGSGLGLSIVRGIADSSGAWVVVDDSRWGGARFAVAFPAAS
ncbi:sensor histidine kinase [Microbacterium aoyamense]|uniref:sensor histidine kinase n=1 Tax=Microbacterium aoyamense TaxID=344166 RepID=UPI002004E292|nr:HAMP domain-containing sensor histidine kinase [Microbacterium aoyamense]